MKFSFKNVKIKYYFLIKTLFYMVDVEKSKAKSKRPTLPQSVIDFYAKFKNDKPLKVSNIVGDRFEMEERYEIFDSSEFFFYQRNFLWVLSWKRVLWSSGGG